MKRVAVAGIAVILGFAFIYVWQAGLPNPFAATYDGWTAGDLDTCPEPNFDPAVGEAQPSAWDCAATLARWLAAARAAFDRRDPDHTPVRLATLHYNASNKQFLSAPLEVAVFELADGTVRAIGVGHFGVDFAHISTADYGPDE